MSSALVATVGQPDYVWTVSACNVEYIFYLMGCMGAEGEFEKVEFTFSGFSDPSASLSYEVFVIGYVTVVGAGSF